MMEYALSVETSSDPGVPVHCVFGGNVATPYKFSFQSSEDVTTSSLKLTLADGDGTVDEDSLKVCTRWSSTVKTYKVTGAVHNGFLDIDQVVDIIAAVATNNETAWRNWKTPLPSELKVSNNSTFATPQQIYKIPRDTIFV